MNGLRLNYTETVMTLFMSEHDPDAAPYMNIIEWMGRGSVVGMHWYKLIDLGEAHVLYTTVHAACGGNATRSNHLTTTYNQILYFDTTHHSLHLLCYIILFIKLLCYIILLIKLLCYIILLIKLLCYTILLIKLLCHIILLITLLCYIILIIKLLCYI